VALPLHWCNAEVFVTVALALFQYFSPYPDSEFDHKKTFSIKNKKPISAFNGFFLTDDYCLKAVLTVIFTG
jgi:hypothetical protein